MTHKKYLGALSSLLVAWPSIVLCLAASLLCNWAGLILVPILFLLLGLLGLLSRLWGMGSLRGVGATLECEHATLFPGDEVTVTYTVENKKFLPLIWLELCQSAPLNNCMEPDDSFALYKPDEAEAATIGVNALYRRRLLFLLGWRSLSWETQWSAKRRGIYPITQFALRSGDGFGLTQSARIVSLSRAPMLVVYPRLLSVTAAPFLHNAWQGQTGRRGHVEDPTVLRNLRAYQPTDPWKRIDWRMAARQDELQVKLFETVLPATIHFIVDGASFLNLSEENEELEQALAILGSLLMELDRAGVTCGLSLPATASHSSVDLSPTDPSLGVHDLMFQLAAFDACSATDSFHEELLGTLAQSVGQIWLISHSPKTVSCPSLLDLLDGQGLGVLCWTGDSFDGFRTLSLPGLKIGGDSQ